MDERDSDWEAPSEDVHDQAAQLEAASETPSTPLNTEAEAPEADVLEQATPAGPAAPTVPERITDDPEAPEADAIEQAMPVPEVDEEELRSEAGGQAGKGTGDW
jgi:hypothetical protein